ncbi:hypothetical protein SDC9_158971 [bioreactor metagenome]|uniref:Uncharacterized protein n=1 Tax=bioreactor metagenome TaxID=1076179 RepID=A0A645FBM3_9ZZZZ
MMGKLVEFSAGKRDVHMHRSGAVGGEIRQIYIGRGDA